ncbi:hypothetical protein BX264_3010 [Streptomyces sp. 2333.5]|uniref:hypothetical protein n=1 Tax=Streptomyces TaxID=1883 RepID=UPI000897AB32|nr:MULTISPECIES: hypothetical protein [unclassified Streptomyces]PJJ02662.1 hypothetical protein BX264_3010 [Streptomyces sp. 2333.5]SEE08523.1 hypothetical protein SAMN05428942_3113 [Streptomyces sp. 2112.2]
MSAHQPFPTPEGPVEAAGREARETPTMNELLAACAAASAVSTPPDAAEEDRRTAGPGAPDEQDVKEKQEKDREEETGAGTRPASTGGRDAA